MKLIIATRRVFFTRQLWLLVYMVHRDNSVLVLEYLTNGTLKRRKLLGMEVLCVLTAVGARLTGRKVGDVVTYAGKPMGSYAK